MDIRQLRQFLAVVDTGSFTKAAELLLVAQPSLSQTIKGLERELEVVLFHLAQSDVHASRVARASDVDQAPAASSWTSTAPASAHRTCTVADEAYRRNHDTCLRA